MNSFFTDFGQNDMERQQAMNNARGLLHTNAFTPEQIAVTSGLSYEDVLQLKIQETGSAFPDNNSGNLN